jgi:hypothetical protein
MMWHNNVNFFDILNRFQTTSQTFKNTNFINKTCLKTPIINNTLPCLIYKNVKTTHNKHVNYKTPRQTFTFSTQDIHFDTCPFHFKLSTIPSQMNGFHHKLSLKKKHVSKIIWRKLCHVRWFLK